jgi:hypothetical protein
VKIPTPAEYRQTYLEAVSPHVPEPILELGFLSKPGLVASYKADQLTGTVLYQISPLANRFLHKQKKLTQRIHVDFSTGESLEFDINRSAGPWATFNEPMRDLLMQVVTG